MHPLSTENKVQREQKVISPKLLKAMAKVTEVMKNLNSPSPGFLHHSEEKLFLSTKVLPKRRLHMGHFILK